MIRFFRPEPFAKCHEAATPGLIGTCDNVLRRSYIAEL